MRPTAVRGTWGLRTTSHCGHQLPSKQGAIHDGDIVCELDPELVDVAVDERQRLRLQLRLGLLQQGRDASNAHNRHHRVSDRGTQTARERETPWESGQGGDGAAMNNSESGQVTQTQGRRGRGSNGDVRLLGKFSGEKRKPRVTFCHTQFQCRLIP
jgi:hypothetical protein